MMLDATQLTQRFRARDIASDGAFEVLKSLCALVSQSQEEYDPRAQELVLRALDQRDVFDQYADILNGLARQLGLYPYLVADNLSIRDALAREFHRPINVVGQNEPEEQRGLTQQTKENGLIFHRVQAYIFRELLDGKSIILSAPTSFGKSLIVDALIESGQFANVVIVVPTIALIDETRRRLSRFRSTHKVITHASQVLAERNIFIFTQERVVDYPELPDLDLFVLDEFYKLNPTEDQDRASTLNHAFYKLTKKAKQFYLLGPNIRRIPEGFPERFQCQFFCTDYSTVVTELIPVNPERGKENDQLVELCKTLSDATLIYCASPAKARKIVNLLLKSKQIENGKNMAEAADWISQHYHADWTFTKGLRYGIGMHHGRMPRALAQLAVRGFNEEKLRFLVCTSTLIEGVNTKAKNVIIFDNKIAKKKYDYFTFNNIRGRSGRMFQHFVGNVYLFHPEPQEELPFVDIPVFSQNERNTLESLLIQLDDSDLVEGSHRRLEPYKKQSILSMEVMRQNIGIEPQQQLELALFLRKHQDNLTKLAWNRYPTYAQLETLCMLIWEYFINGNQRIGGVNSGKQLAFKLNQIRKSSLSQLISDEEKNTNSIDEAVEGVLDFIRQWPQYRFGRYAMGVNRIQEVLAKELDVSVADYSFYVSQVENFFSDASLMALDEYGIPFPLAKKLEANLSSDGNLDGALEKLKALNISTLQLTNFEKELLEEARSYI